MNGWGKAEPGDDVIPQQKPRLLRKMATLLYGEPINLRQISIETGISEDLLSEILCVDLPRKTGRLLHFKPTGIASKNDAIDSPESDASNQ
jgi:hypothetical protein